jgi:Fe-S-cluster containining protein
MSILSRKERWYIAGLAFECTGCGSCCAGPGEGYVWTTTEEIAHIADMLGIPEREMRRKYVRKVGRRFSLVERVDNKDCIFLVPDGEGGRKCKIYDVRPHQCRTWPFWPSNLGKPDDWAYAGLRCPGINRGAVHDLDEIEAKRRVTVP